MYSLFDRFTKKNIKTLNNINLGNQKKALILGSNPNNLQNKKLLEDKIKKENYFVLALNTTKHINEKLIDYRISSHPLRLTSEIENFRKTNSKIILPTGILPENILSRLDKKKLYFYNLIIKPNLIKISKDFCILPSAISIAFAIAILIKFRFNYIELSGFDLRKSSADNTFDILKKMNKTKNKKTFKYLENLNII